MKERIDKEQNVKEELKKLITKNGMVKIHQYLL